MLEPILGVAAIGMLGMASYALIVNHIERRDNRNQIEDGDVVFTATVETPEPPPAPVIGEPFLELVRLYKENHRRFTASFKYDPKSCTDMYWLTDKHTKEDFHITRRRDSYGICHEGKYRGLDWATTDELDYVVSQVERTLTDRRVRLFRILADKADAKQSAERDRLKKVYKV